MSRTDAAPAPRANPNACPVRIRGVDYPSMSAAARALGVTHQAVSWAAEHGWLDGVGLRKAAGKKLPPGAGKGG